MAVTNVSLKNIRQDSDILYQCEYNSPFGKIHLTSDGEFLTSLSFKKAIGKFLNLDTLPIFTETFRWLDIYFSGVDPNYLPPYRTIGETAFRAEVVAELLKIPFGQTTTYGDIAKILAKKRNISRMSAQAVGGAVGWNPICLIIPCHRIVGNNQELVGYSCGIDIKRKLLAWESQQVKLYVKKQTKL